MLRPLGSPAAQIEYVGSEWSVQENEAEFASRTKPSHKPLLKFFKLRTTKAGEEVQNKVWIRSYLNSLLRRNYCYVPHTV